MFRETHYDESFSQESSKKRSNKKAPDSQLDLYSAFEQADQDDLKKPVVEEELKTLPTPEEYAKLEGEMKAKIREAYDEHWYKEARKKDQIYREMLKRFRAPGNKKTSLEILSELRKEEEAAREAENSAREAKVKAYFDKINGRQSNNKTEDISSPADEINEDGSVKPFNPGEEYYTRFK